MPGEAKGDQIAHHDTTVTAEAAASGGCNNQKSNARVILPASSAHLGGDEGRRLGDV